MWHDATGATFPDWVEIAFAGSKTIDEVVVYGVQDAWNTPSEPTPTMTWLYWGISDFTVQAWTGAEWQTVPGGVIRSNNLVRRALTFAPITTSRIRVLSERTIDGWSRLTEVEAFESEGGISGNTAPGGGPGRVNFAAASQGGTAGASSSYDPATYNVSAVIDGDRSGVYYGGNGVWHDATGSAYPDWVQIAFAGNLD